MRLLLTLTLLLALVGTGYATDSAWIDRDGVTTSLVLTPANLGAATAAQGAKADSALQSANYLVKNVQSLGIVADGGDRGAAIQALFDAAVNNDTFYFPKGNYGTSVQIKLPSDKLIRIIGDGPGATTFTALSPLRSVFLKEGSRIEGVEFRDFAIEGNIPSKADIGITLRSGVETKIENVYIARTIESGLAFGIPNAWNSGYTYGQYQYVTYSGHIFRSLQNNNANHTPTVGGDSWWVDLEAYDVASNGLIYDTRMKSVTLRSANSPSQGMFGIHQYASANDNWIGNCIIANYAVANIFDEAGYTFYHKVYMNGSPMSSSPLYGIWSVTQFSTAGNDGGITVEQSYFDGIGPLAGGGAAIRLDKGGNLITGSTFYRNGGVASTNAGVEMKSGITRTTIANNRFDNTVPVSFQGGGTYGAEYYFTGNIGGLAPGSTTNIINSMPVGTPASAGLGSVTNDAQVKVSQLVTTLGSPGSDTNVPTEKAVRSAIAASGSVTVKTNGVNNGSQSTLDLKAGTNMTLTDNGSGQITFDASPGGGGSGTVGNGTTGQFAYYGSSGTTVTGRTLVAGDIPAIPESGVTNLPMDLAAKENTANKAAANGYASLNSSSKVVQNPASAGTFFSANQIPLTDSNGQMAAFYSNSSGAWTLFGDNGAATKHINLSLLSYAGAQVSRPYLRLSNAGGSYAAPANSFSGQILGSLIFGGYGTTGLKYAAFIEGLATSNHTDADQPTALTFSTGSTGTSGTPSERMRIQLGLSVGTSTDPGAGSVKAVGDVSAKTFTSTIPAATTYAATTTIDLALGDSPSVTLTGNTTLAFSNPKAGQWHRLNLVQDATGSRTVTWPSTGLVCTWRNTASHTAPTLLTAASAVDTIIMHTLSTTSAECWTAGNK